MPRPHLLADVGPVGLDDRGSSPCSMKPSTSPGSSKPSTRIGRPETCRSWLPAIGQEPTFPTARIEVGFLRAHGLEHEVKLNPEVNHATLPGHSFKHEVATAAALGVAELYLYTADAMGVIDFYQRLGWRHCDRLALGGIEAVVMATTPRRAA